MADKYYVNGWTYEGPLKSIRGTIQDKLYSSHRAFCCGGGGYSIPVPKSGKYTVVLMFAEIYFEQINLRTFKVLIEGKVAKANLDVFGKVGADRAYRMTTVVTVVDGNIDIKLESLIENPMISGIQIITGQVIPAPVSCSKLFFVLFRRFVSSDLCHFVHELLLFMIASCSLSNQCWIFK
jgi:Malectin domain